MVLPIFNELKNDESTYITLSRAYVDMDFAIANNTEYYYSKVVALNLPQWETGKFYTEILRTINITDVSPNVIIPKLLQFYVENMIRQNSIDTPEIAEIGLWKA